MVRFVLSLICMSGAMGLCGLRLHAGDMDVKRLAARLKSRSKPKPENKPIKVHSQAAMDEIFKDGNGVRYVYGEPYSYGKPRDKDGASLWLVESEVVDPDHYFHGSLEDIQKRTRAFAVNILRTLPEQARIEINASSSFVKQIKIVAKFVPSAILQECQNDLRLAIESHRRGHAVAREERRERRKVLLYDRSSRGRPSYRASFSQAGFAAYAGSGQD